MFQCGNGQRYRARCSEHHVLAIARSRQLLHADSSRTFAARDRRSSLERDRTRYRDHELQKSVAYQMDKGRHVAVARLMRNSATLDVSLMSERRRSNEY